jgi:hypothetical protein
MLFKGMPTLVVNVAGLPSSLQDSEEINKEDRKIIRDSEDDRKPAAIEEVTPS